MKKNKHIQSFNEHQEKLDISDVIISDLDKDFFDEKTLHKIIDDINNTNNIDKLKEVKKIWLNVNDNNLKTTIVNYIDKKISNH